jgi:porin
MPARHVSTPLFITLTAGFSLWAATALATPPVPSAGDATNASTATQPNDTGMWNGWDHRPTLLGDMGGLRPFLRDYGVSLNLIETSEILGNTSGGVRRGVDYDGLTTLTLQMDTDKAFGLAGGTINLSALDIHGSNLSAQNLLTFQTASGIEADNTARLWELWYQQSLLDDKITVRIGQ